MNLLGSYLSTCETKTVVISNERVHRWTSKKSNKAVPVAVITRLKHGILHLSTIALPSWASCLHQQTFNSTVTLVKYNGYINDYKCYTSITAITQLSHFS